MIKTSLYKETRLITTASVDLTVIGSCMSSKGVDFFRDVRYNKNAGGLLDGSRA